MVSRPIRSSFWRPKIVLRRLPQRADALSERLNRLGIPNVRSASYSVNRNDPSAEQKAGLDRAVGVLNGEIPAVFVNGMAKANPSAEEVAAEYARTK